MSRSNKGNFSKIERLEEDFGEIGTCKVMKSLTIEMEDIAELMCGIHNELVELSEWITYIHPQEMSDDYEKFAGDHLKTLASNLMNEIQRIYPVDY